MYWVNGIASQLSLDCTYKKDDEKQLKTSDIVCIQQSFHASLFITCTRSAIYLWSVKPTTVLSFVERSESHLEEFGENVKITWKPDATAIVIHTSKNYLLLYAIIAFDQRSFEFNFPNSAHAFVTGPGEGKGPKTMLIKFRLAIRVDAGMTCGTCSDDTVILATHSPPAIQSISWNPQHVNATQTTLLAKLDIMQDDTEKVCEMVYEKSMSISIWITTAGRAYFIQNHTQGKTGPTMPSFTTKIQWSGNCFHQQDATHVSINPKFSLIAIGTKSGTVYVYSIQNYTSPPTLSHTLVLNSWSSQQSGDSNSVQSLEWTSDGYAIAVGFKKCGLAVWSAFGGLLCASSEMDDMFNGNSPHKLKDTYVRGIKSLFWGPGCHQLFVLSVEGSGDEEMKAKFFTIPFTKSALTSYHHSDNARRGLLQTDDRILLYNNGGGYQENNTAIDPAAVAWTHIQYPTLYITDHWPIRYASISADGRYIAIAGKRGFAHYNAVSNRWKLFGNQQQEQSFLVRGGMVWYKSILIVPCEILSNKSYEIRLYSRDSNLDNAYIIYTETLSNIPAYITLCGNFLLVYTSENVLNIYNINSTNNNKARLEMVRRISLGGIVTRISKVRSISLFNPFNGDQMNSIEDIISANIILLVDGKLVMLCPKESDDDDDSDLNPNVFSPLNQYDIHTISQKSEYYWIGKKSVNNMRTSLWVADGKGLKVFTNLLLSDNFGFNSISNDSYESEPSTPTTPAMLSNRSDLGRPFSLGYRIGPEPVSPSASIADLEGYSKWKIASFDDLNANTIYTPLDFYPLSIMLDKGVIVGIEQNISYKESLGFVLFKMSPKMHLFLHHILRHLLKSGLEEDAVLFARSYEKFVYFGHALEILLHTVLEEEAGHDLGDDAILPLVVKFLDQFPHALDVIVSCARKTEVALWDHLFSVVGKPKDLFELCLADGRLRTATSYLIILQTMQPLAIGGKDTIRLLQKAMEENDYELCKELVRFLSSIDNTGQTLQETLQMIKSCMEQGDPLSPNTEDAQIDKVVQSMRSVLKKN
ncbi:RIC1-domain-containing protein [Backusella circina FSU 941]|nr:RIC1-domain-containing protein [Backusella circina FSU 941]